MSKKTKLYIPLLSKNGKTILLNTGKVKGLKEIIPGTTSIQENLMAGQIKEQKYNEPYSPLMVKVSKEKWEELEKEINTKNPGHRFIKKGFDIVSDIRPLIILVQIICI